MSERMRFFCSEEIRLFIIMKYEEGWSARKIAKELHMGRNTVRDVIHRVHRHREEGHDILEGKRPKKRASKLDSHLPQIKAILGLYPDATAVRIHEEIKEKGYTGGMSILKALIHNLRPKPAPRIHTRIETEPGRQGQMDWSPYTLNFRRAGKLIVNCFSYVLGFSRRQFIDFTTKRTFHVLIWRHQDAFSYFGGVPCECLYDNEKTVVLRWEAGQPIFNPAFIAFITHYDCRPIACKPGTPWWKGKVEAPFLYIEKNLLNARDFDDLEDLRSFARWWLANRSDSHIHDTTKRAPLELFLAEEAHQLKALPRHPYDSAQVGFRIGRLDGFVEWDTNFYSISYEHATEILTVKAMEKELFIYGPDLTIIATHERMPLGANRKSELPEHRTSKEIRYGLEPVRESFLALGESTEVFLSGLKSRFHRNPGFHARRILLLKEKYHCDDIHKAIVHAIRYHAYDCRAIERILIAHYKERPLEEMIIEKTAKELRKALPKIEQRSLREYKEIYSSQEDDEEGAKDESEF